MAFFVPGAASGAAGGNAGAAFAKPTFFQPAATADAGGDPPAGEQQQQPERGSSDLPNVRTELAGEAATEANGGLHWASSEALLHAEDGAASPPAVKQVREHSRSCTFPAGNVDHAVSVYPHVCVMLSGCVLSAN